LDAKRKDGGSNLGFTIEFRNTVKPDPEKEFMIMMLMKCR
jgi:hypothetical protein